MDRENVGPTSGLVRSAAIGDGALRKLADLPGPKGVPVLGNASQVDVMHFHRTLEEWAREYGPLYRFALMQRTFVAASSHDVVAGMLRERPELVRRWGRLSDIVDEATVPGVFTAEGAEWRRQRKLVMHALTPEVVHRFFPALSAMTARLLARWRRQLAAGAAVDMLRDLKAYTLDVTIALAMGQDINALEHEDNPLQRDIEFLFERIARRLISPFAYWRVFKLPADRKAVAASARIRQAVAGFIADARTRMNASPGLRARPGNLLEAMVCARDEPDSGFDDTAVIGNAMTLVFAGEDTTSNSVAWLLNLLAQHPPQAQALAAEADGVLAGAEVLDDYRLLEHLPRLDAAVRESMRLKPVAPLIALEPNVDMVLGDVLVPAGTAVYLLMRQAAERGGGLEQPQAFRPERWLDDGHALRDAGAGPARRLFPFGGGPRFCPGRYLAMVEIKMLMTMVMRNFSIERIAGAPEVEERFAFTMTPGALPLLLRERRKSC